MKSTNIWKYIWVGTCLRFLQDQKKGWKFHGDSYALGNINSFLEHLNNLGLHVTRRASYELETLRDEMSQQPVDYLLTESDAERICKLADEIRLTFQAETQGVFTYVVTDKRLDINKLLNHADKLFSLSIYDACPEIARYDFNEAGKCIAFERPTAAAFHILRGTESVLRYYYKRYIRPAQAGLTWGQMTHALKNKSTGKKPEKLITNHLDHIREGFRNPTQHPDKIYSIDEVQDLFGLCIDVVNRMIGAVSAK